MSIQLVLLFDTSFCLLYGIGIKSVPKEKKINPSFLIVKEGNMAFDSSFPAYIGNNLSA